MESRVYPLPWQTNTVITHENLASHKFSQVVRIVSKSSDPQRHPRRAELEKLYQKVKRGPNMECAAEAMRVLEVSGFLSSSDGGGVEEEPAQRGAPGKRSAPEEAPHPASPKVSRPEGAAACSGAAEFVSPCKGVVVGDKAVVVRLSGSFDRANVQQVNTDLEKWRQKIFNIIMQTQEGMEIVDRTPSGLKWRKIGTAQPDGRLLQNAKLSSALSGKCASVAFTQREWNAFDIKDLHMDNFVKSDDSCYFKPARQQGLPQDRLLMVYVSVGPWPPNALDGGWEQELQNFIAVNCRVFLKANRRHAEYSEWTGDKIGISVLHAEERDVRIVLDQKDGGEEHEMLDYVKQEL